MPELQETHSLADFLSNHQEHLERIKESGRPEVLTVNGKPELVLQDAAAYRQLLDRLRAAEDLQAIRRGIAEADRGEGRPADEVFAELKATYGL